MTPDEIIRLIDQLAVDADLKREISQRAGRMVRAVAYEVQAKTYADLAEELRRRVEVMV